MGTRPSQGRTPEALEGEGYREPCRYRYQTLEHRRGRKEVDRDRASSGDEKGLRTVPKKQRHVEALVAVLAQGGLVREVVQKVEK